MRHVNNQVSYFQFSLHRKYSNLKSIVQSIRLSPEKYPAVALSFIRIAWTIRLEYLSFLLTHIRFDNVPEGRIIEQVNNVLDVKRTQLVFFGDNAQKFARRWKQWH